MPPPCAEQTSRHAQRHHVESGIVGARTLTDITEESGVRAKIGHRFMETMHVVLAHPAEYNALVSCYGMNFTGTARRRPVATFCAVEGIHTI